MRLSLHAAIVLLIHFRRHLPYIVTVASEIAGEASERKVNEQSSLCLAGLSLLCFSSPITTDMKTLTSLHRCHI